MDFEITTRHQPGVGSILEPRGDVDIYTCARLREAIINAVAEGDGAIVVSLEGVGFIDSTGLGVLVGGRKRAKGADRPFLVICNHELSLKVFRITGLDKILDIYPSLDSIEGLVQSH